MRTLLPKPFIGIIGIFLHAVNSASLPFAVHLLAIFKYLLPNNTWRRMWDRWMNYLPLLWGDINKFIIWFTTPTIFEIHGLENLSTKEWYLITSNHQSWVDILILYKVLNRKIPIIKFFMKRELLRLPIVGTCCWLLNFPFMYRHSKEQIAKNPALKGKDLEITRFYCQRFKEFPQSIVTFAEGTRYTNKKAQQQKSPYQHLLNPRAGGLAFILQAMDGQLHRFLNITVAYSKPHTSFWDFACGKVKKIIITIDNKPITSEMTGNYENDREFRVQFQRWLNELWQEKDCQLIEYHEKFKSYAE